MHITSRSPLWRDVAVNDKPLVVKGAPAARPVASEAGELAPVAAELQAMPEVDLDKVAAVRAALARGEVKFDADKIAGLVAQYHGGRG